MARTFLSPLLAALLVGPSTLPAPAQSKAAPKADLPVALAYTRGDGVFVLPAHAAAPVKWSASDHAVDARLSPAGDALAYTWDTSGKEVSKEGPTRRIAVIEAPGAAPRLLDAIPGRNSFGPLWSPDGRLLLFQHYVDKQWKIAVVGRDGKGFRDVRGPAGATTFLSHACWAGDSRSFYAFDFESLYRFDLEGKELSRLAWKDCDLEIGSSACQFRLSPDGTRLLVQAEIEVADLKNDDYPSPVCFILDLASKKAVRVSPKGMMLTQPEWLPDGTAFVAQRGEGKKSSLVRVDLATGKASLLVPGGSWPSLAR